MRIQKRLRQNIQKKIIATTTLLFLQKVDGIKYNPFLSKNIKDLLIAQVMVDEGIVDYLVS